MTIEFPDNSSDDRHESREASWSPLSAEDAKVFSLIVDDWADKQPLPQDFIDAGLVAIIDLIRKRSEKLLATDLSSDREEIVAEIEAVLKEANLFRRVVYVTGKARPTVTLSGEEAMNVELDEDELEEAVAMLPDMKVDAHGRYYDLRDFPFQIVRPHIRSEKVLEGYGLETSIDGVDLGLSLDGIESIEPLFSMHPDDIEYVNIGPPTAEGAELLLREYVGEVMKTIDAIVPDACRDDARIFEALNELTIEIPPPVSQAH